MSAADFVPAGADLDQLRAAAQDCRGCELWQGATQTVFSAGAPDARVVLVGEQPGDQEDRQGLPFVGPAGRVLVKAVDDAGIPREVIYRTNVVKHFRFSRSGPGKRRIHQTPDQVHVEACQPWLTAELTLLEPEIVVCLGATAAKALLGPSFRVTRQRGELFRHPVGRAVDAEAAEHTRWIMATIHPSAVLRADDRQTAYDGLVADLRVAAKALR
ncbi:MAG TPA: UdgX family uracil-DNA binding protein [Candidatus Eisenbacteria bacterium]|nr:UdgX family uracil-DNA binding protein [Candidatus Eisenbacteria bacterium]